MTRTAIKQAWVNGVYVAADEAKISPFDRGFLFADGVYEVTAVYDGRPVDMERHLDRLERSLRELKFGTMPDRKEIEDVHRTLIANNGIDEGYVYLQVTRGAYGARDFVAPDAPRLTIFMFVESRPLIDTPSARNGIRIVALPDIRWARRDIKSVGLLAQALAKTEAKARGADDAWLVAPDGFVTEGASANAWIVTKDGEIITRALSNMILAGVTRHASVRCARPARRQDHRAELYRRRSQGCRRSLHHRRNRAGDACRRNRRRQSSVLANPARSPATFRKSTTPRSARMWRGPRRSSTTKRD